MRGRVGTLNMARCEFQDPPPFSTVWDALGRDYHLRIMRRLCPAGLRFRNLRLANENIMPGSRVGWREFSVGGP